MKFKKQIIPESLVCPYEGIFWIIDDELIALTDSVNPNNHFDCTDLLHRESWKYLKDQYKVNGRCVGYNYFPRGRVETLVIQNNAGNLDHYEANIYIDKCIDNIRNRDRIEDKFRLYLPKVIINYSGQLYIDGSHYTCYQCRK